MVYLLWADYVFHLSGENRVGKLRLTLLHRLVSYEDLAQPVVCAEEQIRELGTKNDFTVKQKQDTKITLVLKESKYPIFILNNVGSSATRTHKYTN